MVVVALIVLTLVTSQRKVSPLTLPGALAVRETVQIGALVGTAGITPVRRIQEYLNQRW